MGPRIADKAIKEREFLFAAAIFWKQFDIE
jgi:hypothetical protein